HDAGHLPEGALGVVEVVEGADAQDAVEAVIAERQVLGLAQDERQVAALGAAAAGAELGGRGCDAHDVPGRPQPGEIGPPAQVAGRQGRYAPWPRATSSSFRWGVWGRWRRILLRDRRSPPLQRKVNHSQKRNLGQRGLL